MGRSIYAPAFQISQFNPDLLMEFVEKNFKLDRLSMSGVGVEHSVLLDAANSINVESGSASGEAAKYYGGEYREPSEHLKAFTVLVGQGAR